MKGPLSQRKEDDLIRQEWTARLDRFARAKTAEQRRDAIEAHLKINPGGSMKEMLAAWGYSASGRGRKPKGTPDAEHRKPARERLEGVLNELYGVKPTPVSNLYKKLAGAAAVTVNDACRIVAALVSSWPEKLPLASPGKIKESAKQRAQNFGEAFMRELLSDLSSGRSQEWTFEEMETRGFPLINEERIGVKHFLKDVTESEGALIVAGWRKILLGTDPIKVIRDFMELTQIFVESDNKSLIVFVFDLALFEAEEYGTNLIYNLNLLSAAIISFSLFETKHLNGTINQKYQSNFPVIKHNVDWSRWRVLSKRCCAVIRRPTMLNPKTGEFITRDRRDEFIKTIWPKKSIESIVDLQGIIRFDHSHILPRRYPKNLSENEDLSAEPLYWDIVVKPSEDGILSIEYYTPISERTFSSETEYWGEEKLRKAGRPLVNITPIEEDFFYVVKRQSPGERYDHAQRAIYLAARARLGMDSGSRQIENLNAAAALRQNGFEVWPISVLISFFPQILNLAAEETSLARRSMRDET
jgi:hypothetical protein